VASLVASNVNEVIVAHVAAPACGLESGGRLYFGASGRNLASVALKMFSHLIYFIKKCCTYCALHAIYKDNAGINYITV
jgi:hypothetical protein